MPNSALPLLVYPQAVAPEKQTAEKAQAMLRAHGWQGTWAWSVYPFWHFHTLGHEVLACVAGEALIGLGGEDGIEQPMRAGDAVAIPAGVGHKRLEASDGFTVVGAYPPGQRADIVRAGEMDLEAARRTIETLPLPETDPVLGGDGALVRAWREG